MKTRPAISIALTLALGCAMGCAGASFRNGVYEDENVRYRVGALGSAWRRVDVEGDDLAFRRAGFGTISVNSTCTDYEDVPTTALLNHLLFETRARRFLVEEDVTLDGRGARHVIAQVELDGVPVELEIFLLKKDGCVFDLVHVCGVPAPAGASEEFEAFVQRFAVLRVGPHE